MKKNLLKSLPMLFVSLLFAVQSAYARRRRIALFVALLCCSSVAMAQIYVSPSGDDSNNGTAGSPKKSIQAGVDIASTGQTVFIDPGTYAENVTINKDNITLQGAGSGANGNLAPVTPNAASHTIISGGVGSKGIQLSGARTNVSIKAIAILGHSMEGFFADANSVNLILQDLQVNDNCTGATGRGGIYVVGGVTNVTITGCAVQNNGPGESARGIAIWDNYKAGVTIANNYVVFTACCGIDLNDGTSSGVNISNNTLIAGTGGDSAIGVLGMKSGTGPNIIANNNITIAKRYGIEIKNPAGSGIDDEAADGSIVVKDNTITRTGDITTGPLLERRDLAGIAIFRRSFTSGNPAGYIDVPSGVVVKGNTISGFQQPDAIGEGYGVVAEGVRMTIKNNTINNCDVGVQRQSGNSSNYAKNNTGDADQAAAGSNYFNRGNSPFSSAIIVENNTFSANMLDARDEFAANSYFNDAQFVFNSTSNTNYATLNLAVEYAGAGNTLQPSAHTFDELVVVDKSLTIDGVDKATRIIKYTGAAISSGSVTPALFKIAAPNVTITNLTMDVDLTKIWSAIISHGDVAGLSIIGNNILATRSAVSSAAGYTDRNAVGINISGRSIPGVTNASNPSGLVTFQGNTVSYTPDPTPANVAAFRAALAVDNYNVLVENNTTAAINHDVTNRFQTTVGQSILRNNTFNGGGIEFSEPNAPFAGALIEDNNFNYLLGGFPTFALVRFKNNNANKPFVFKNNQVQNHYWLMSLENFQNIDVEENTFTPVKNASDYFQILSINTKTIASSNNTKLPNSANIVGNTFNGVAGSVNAKGIAFYNHDNASPQFGAFTIGAVAKPNLFNDNINQYLYIDNNNGNLTKDGGNVALAGYPEYGSNISATTTGYWTTDIRADENNFYIDGQLRSAAALNQAQRAMLDSKIFDYIDDNSIGKVLYYFPVTNVTTGVKFASIQSAIDAAAVGQEITTLPGEYLENVIINKQNLKLIGPGANLATIKGIKVAGGTTVALAQAGVVLEGFTITRDGNNVTDWNGAINNQGVSMNANNTTARRLLITGNRNGLYINNRQNVLVENCDIDNNHTGIQVVNNISGAIIRNNNITNNRTLGFLFLDIAGGQTTGADIVKNNITDNWYSQVEFRGANTNVINFGANYLGNAAISVDNVPAGEESYANLIPVFFGGTFVKPSTSKMISGINSAKVDYSVSLPSYTDTDVAIGFQPDSSTVWVFEASPVATVSPKLTSASTIVAPNGTIVIKDAAISSGGAITKDVVLDADAASVTINGDVTVNTTTLTLAKATTIGGGFTLTSGQVNPSSTFTLNGAIATTSGIANFINGTVTVNNVNTDLVIPIGKNNKAAYVGLSGVTGSASVTATYFPSAYADLTKDAALASLSDKEYWSVTSSGGLTAKVRLYSFDLSASGLSASDLTDAVVARYDNVGVKWETLGNGDFQAGTNNYVTANLTTSNFGDFTFGVNTQVLPVALLSFTAQATTGGALVKWSTSEEKNNAKFEIEKSFDGKNFFIVETRKGQGTTAIATNYEFLDASFKQSAYYRLVQIDVNGDKTTYSDLVKFVKGLGNSLSVVAYPNPVVNKLYVNLGATTKENVKLQLVDLTGKALRVKITDGLQPIELDVAGIATGSYILQVIKATGNVSKKIVKL